MNDQQLDAYLSRVVPEHLRNDMKAAMKNGASLSRGQFYEGGESVFELRWPDGGVTDLRPVLQGGSDV